MSDEREILLGTVDRIFGEIADNVDADGVTTDEQLRRDWVPLEEAGLTLALVDERDGGAGLDVSDACAVLRRAGAFALSLPLAETMIANRVWTQSGRPPVPGILSLASGSPRDHLELSRVGDGWHVSGQLERVPWARNANFVLAARDNTLMMLPIEICNVRPGTNLAGEPRDLVTVDGWLADAAKVDTGRPAASLLRLIGAAARSVQMAGAIERIMELTIDYVNERSQFGKTLGKFQAIQQYMAELAGQVAATAVAADIAVEGFAEGYATLPIAIAKSRASEAAGVVCSITHQIHGAMGITREYPLQLHTRRLWSWRDEFGAEREWQSRVGREVEAAGPDGLWPLVTSI